MPARRPEPLDLADLPGGPKPGTALCRIDDIEDGGALVLTFGEGRSRCEIFIQRRGGAVFAYENSCPHARHPLDWSPGRFLDATGALLQCASHGAQFRIEDGFCVAGPCKGRYLRPVTILLDEATVFSTT